MDIPVRRSGSDLLVTRHGGQVVVLDRSASTYHHLNPLTTFVWERCDGETDPVELARAVAEAFETASADELVRGALDRLASAGLLEDAGVSQVSGSPGPPHGPVR